MRLASTSILLLLMAFTCTRHASAQQADALRMGPQLQLPTLLRGSLQRSHAPHARLGFTPAHEKQAPVAASPAPALAQQPIAPETAAIEQTQATLELPPPDDSIESRSAMPAPGESILVPQGEGVIIDESPLDIQFDVTGEVYPEGTVVQGTPQGCGSQCGGCFDCCIQLPRICLPRLPKENLSFFAGVQGFKGPVNRGSDGSFGFNEGLNWGAPVPWGGYNMGAQLGIRGVQSNFHGTGFTDEERRQFYLTAGLFRRADCGLQFGGVVDFQHDDWYAQSDLAQFRVEISWLNGCASEIGLMATTGGQDETGTATLRDDQGATFTVTESRHTTDYYAFFYRHRLQCSEGDWRVYGGFTDDSDGLVGADAQVALSSCWSLQSRFSYLVPERNNAAAGNRDESWNVGINLVFHPWGGGRTTGNYYRPLFNVADNGSFFVDVR